MQHSVRLWSFMHAGYRHYLLRCCFSTLVAGDGVSVKIFTLSNVHGGSECAPLTRSFSLHANVVHRETESLSHE